jgi:tRNA-2-methylthio-N6-dimethylallyladenosine synthase
MSVHDGERIEEALRADGYARAADPAAADVVVLTTCSVREKARQKVHSAIGRMRAWKAQRPGQVLVVAGCVAQQDGEGLLDAAPHVDVVVGSEHLGRTAELVARAVDRGERLCVVGFEAEAPTPFLPLGIAAGASVSAYVTIQKGCNEGCAYCIVPTVRGPGRCRPAQEVVGEVEALCARGAREIVLLGQTVNSYRDGPCGFGELLRAVAAVPGVARIRYESAHPRFLAAELVAAHVEVAAVCEHLHLPVQSGSDEVLRRMGRGHGRADFLGWLASLRRAVPGVGVSTDLFVGFPGEGDDDFEATLELVEEARFDAAFSFKYSPRPGTPAAASDDDVPQHVKVERLARLQELQGRITAELLREQVGRTVEVLVEGESKVGGQLRGRTRRGMVVNVDLPSGGRPALGAGLAGSLVDVEVHAAGGHSLRARLIGDARAPGERDRRAVR